jgi:hypothetical protein
MPALRFTLLVIFLLSYVSPFIPADAAAQNVSLLLGARVPPNKFSESIGVQPELALHVSHQPRSWALGIDAYLAGSFGDQHATVWPPGDDFVRGSFRMITLETGLGVRREGRGAGMRVHVAGGWALSHVQTQERWKDFWHGPVEKYHAFGTMGRYRCYLARRTAHSGWGRWQVQRCECGTRTIR